MNKFPLSMLFREAVHEFHLERMKYLPQKFAQLHRDWVGVDKLHVALLSLAPLVGRTELEVLRPPEGVFALSESYKNTHVRLLQSAGVWRVDVKRAEEGERNE